MGSGEGKDRLEALRRILNHGVQSTQDELCEKLEKQGYKVNQSTVSRDLRKLGTVKVVDSTGQATYRLSESGPSPATATSLADLVLDIQTNGVLVVIHTLPGSASLVARHLDQVRPGGLLGTIAGDDTIFVALSSIKDRKIAIKEIESSFRKVP